MIKKQLAIAAMVAAALPLGAKVTLPAIYSDNMVVQQNSTLKIPGKAAPGAKVTLTTDWQKAPATAKAAADGNFVIEIKAPAAGGPFTMIFNDGTGETVLSNVLSGEVWLASGQSNMEFPVEGDWARLMGSDEVVATMQHPDIRLLQIRNTMSGRPLDDADVEMGWVLSSPAARGFSAIGYLFAKELRDSLKVPVGVIDATWGGTPVEAWTSYEHANKEGDFNQYMEDVKAFDYDIDAMEREKNKAYAAWLTGKADRLCDFDKTRLQSQWPTMNTPGDWEPAIPNFDGIAWMQRSLSLPASAAGKPLKISLAADDDEVTYFNGVKVGSTAGYGVRRIYDVPANLVKDGENIITVVIYDGQGGGGIVGAADKLYAECDGKTYSLAGPWHYKTAVTADKLTGYPRHSGLMGTNRPAVLYNAMIHPLRHLPIKGAIWYQGCNNVGRHQQYERIFKEMITGWREDWNNPTMPFYFVQLAGFLQPQTLQPESAWAYLRNAQAKALELPGTGMATAIDLGHPTDIHPTNKQDVAHRLSLNALKKTYGNSSLVADGPRCISVKADGNRLVLKFDSAVSARNAAVTGFILRDADGRWANANARITGADTVVLSSPLVKKPTVARYNWADYPDGNLYGSTGLPVAPFTTD